MTAPILIHTASGLITLRTACVAMLKDIPSAFGLSADDILDRIYHAPTGQTKIEIINREIKKQLTIEWANSAKGWEITCRIGGIKRCSRKPKKN